LPRFFFGWVFVFLVVMTQMEQMYAETARKVLQTLKEPEGDYGQLNTGLKLMRQHNEKLAARHHNLGKLGNSL